MALNIRNLAEQLLISDQELDDIKKQIVESFDDEKIMRAILSWQLSDREETHCLSCDNEGDCFILIGIIHLRLKEIKKAIKELENANWHLRSKNETWNSIIGLVLLGMTREEYGKNYLALSEYKKAYETLTNNFLRIHVYDQVERARQLEIELREKIKELSAPNLSAVPPSPTNPGNTNPNTSGFDDKDYLALFSIPIYGTVQAGPDGELYVDHFGTFTLVNKIELDGKEFEVHSIQGTAPTDRQITVTTSRTYGWLRVQGLSMNNWDTPFDENDYVLFYKSSIASHLDFVVASNRHPSGGMALIVKRFDEKNNQLLSKSKDTSKSYNPIPLDEDHQIVGVVIAVAKPPGQISTVSHHNPIPKTKSGVETGVSNEASLPFMITKEMRQQLLNQGYSEDDISDMTPQQAWDNIDEDKLFQNLLTKVQGNHEAASRLIELEQRQHPRSNRKELMHLAILKWEKDNR